MPGLPLLDLRSVGSDLHRSGMGTRRKLSFELLRYEYSGDEEVLSDSQRIPAANGADAAKTNGRRRRHNRSAKKRSSNSIPATLDNAQIYGTDQAYVAAASLRKSATVDIGFFAGCLSAVSEEAESHSGTISYSQDFSSAVDHNDNKDNDNSKREEQKTLAEGPGHAKGFPNGVMHIDRADSANHDSLEVIDRSYSMTCWSECDVLNKFTPRVLEWSSSSPEPSRRDDEKDVSNKLAPGVLEQGSFSNVDNVLDNSAPGALEQGSSSWELRRRNNVNGSTMEESTIEVVERKETRSGAATPIGNQKEAEKSCDGGRTAYTTPQSSDWERLMSETSDSCPPPQVEMSPWKYFLGEITGGISLRSTTSVGNDKKRQRVYNTMFHVPWRCEVLIDIGFFVCLDSFLSLLTIMPARILAFLWRCLNVRQFQRPLADELSDFGCLVVLICGVALLQVTDISLIYHFIRGQGTIKLYVVYNVLEILDKLFQSFGGDVLQVLFNSAEGLASSSNENMAFETLRFILDQAIAVIALIVHSFTILAQAITLSAAIISHNNSLVALLISNNFAEIKSSVFKRVSKENLHKMAYYDTVERFHIMAHLIFVLAQNILEAESEWYWSFTMNALCIWGSEVIVDVMKHAFLAKFNEIKPHAYSEFLEALCKQTLNSEIHKTLTFVPLAPACVVIRVLTPIYASCLPSDPIWWRWFYAALLLSVTYSTLVCLKVMVGLGLQVHARWYIRRCIRKKRHLHVD